MKEVDKKQKDLEDEDKMPKLEPGGDYELFVLDSSKPDQTMKIENEVR